MTDSSDPQAATVAAAIRERIRLLREELAHWEDMLRQCEGDGRPAEASEPPRTGTAKSGKGSPPR